MTDRQKEVLKAIKTFWKTFYRPPTYRELASLLGVTVKCIADHITALKKKGFLKDSRKIIPINIEIKFN